jgi:threonine dehydrogenase-like Zn-dependent dehydrogenase
MLYRAQGARQIILIGRSDYRLAFARTLGVDEIIDVRQQDPVAAVKEMTGIGADLVVDAVGNQLNTAVQMARRGGRVILFGLKMHENPAVNQYTITRNDLTLVGTFVGLKPFIQTIHLLESGIIQPSRLATHRVPLTELSRGIDLMRSGSAMKVLVET